MEDRPGNPSEAAQTLSELGASKGGTARAKALTKEQRSEIARMAAETRWEKERKNPPMLRATHEGTLNIGNLSFPCSVLSDGTRILTQTDFMKGMGMYYSGWVSRNRPAEDVAADIPQFLSYKNLKPFVDEHLGELQSITVRYRTERGNRVAHGIKAEIIPKICDVWMDADEHGTLGTRQKHIAKRARLIIRGLAHVGIIALVDEATGYQEVRERKALQAILDAFLRKELAAWASRFPSEFYKELFRLRGWTWESKSGHRPRQVGKDTKDIVYARLAPGILEELEKRNPPNEHWYRKARHHQWLTEDIGDPALAQHLHAVMALMRASRDWGQFKAILNQAFPKRGDTLQLPFMSDLTS